MGFDLYFAGTGSKQGKAKIRELQCNQLLSQLNERKELLDWVEYLRANPGYKGKLFVDSGAYSAYTRGKVIDTDDYIRLINEIGDVVTVFAQVDIIPQKIDGEPTEAEFSAAAGKSWENYLYMISKVKPEYRDKIMPVFHFQEDTKWLTNMLEYTFEDGHHIPYIGLAVSTIDNGATRYAWLEMCFSIIKKSPNPNVMTHAFGMTALSVLEKVPLTSSDSTTWVMTASHGTILVDKKPVPVSDRTTHNNQNLVNKSIGLKDEVAQKVAKYGYTVEELAADYLKRQLYNIEVMKEWADNYEYTGAVMDKVSLF